MGARFSPPVQTGPGAHSASCTMGTGSFPGVKSGRGLTLTPHSLLVPWSRKSRSIPLLSLWAVRPVQSLSACTRVHFTLTFTDERNRHTRYLKSRFKIGFVQGIYNLDKSHPPLWLLLLHPDVVTVSAPFFRNVLTTVLPV